MRSVRRRLARIPNYVHAFGVTEGLKLCIQIERSLPHQSERLRSFNISWAKGPIWLRDTTSDHAIFWQCMVAQHYELGRFTHTQRLLDAYRKVVAKGKRPLIIDGGGNIGLSAIWFALNFPEAKIVVLEPDEENFKILTQNIAPYTDCVEPIRGGVWPRPDRLVIENPASGAAAYRVRPAAQGDRTEIRGRTVSELLTSSNNTEALIIKLDIEGSQRPLFEDNTDWVGCCHLIILELDDWQYPWHGTSRSFFKCISQYPFEYLLSGEHIFCFRDFGAAR